MIISGAKGLKESMQERSGTALALAAGAAGQECDPLSYLKLGALPISIHLSLYVL